MVLSKKEFINFYKAEKEFSKIKGIKIDQNHKKELDDMKHIYDISRDNKDFTKIMFQEGYGQID